MKRSVGGKRHGRRPRSEAPTGLILITPERGRSKPLLARPAPGANCGRWFEVFDIEGVPQNEKRAALARAAIERGIVTVRSRNRIKAVIRASSATYPEPR
jgi:hypothetical protein